MIRTLTTALLVIGGIVIVMAVWGAVNALIWRGLTLLVFGLVIYGGVSWALGPRKQK